MILPFDLRITCTYWTGFTCNILLWLTVFEDLRLFSIWFKNYVYHVMCVLNRLHLWHSFLIDCIWGFKVIFHLIWELRISCYVSIEQASPVTFFYDWLYLRIRGYFPYDLRIIYISCYVRIEQASPVLFFYDWVYLRT